MNSQSAPIFSLIQKKGPEPNRDFQLEKEYITIGRGKANDIVIDDPEVSRNHASLTRHESGWMIEDLGSVNGVWINGQRISEPTILRPGDQVSFGPNILLSMERRSPIPSQASAPSEVTRMSNKHTPTAQPALIISSPKAQNQRKGISTWKILGGAVGLVILGVIALTIIAALFFFFISPTIFKPSQPTPQSPIALPPSSGPDISFQEPSPGTQVGVGESIMVFATARDEKGVTRIDLYVDDQLVIQQDSPDPNGVTPFNLIHGMQATTPGLHGLIARAYNSQGATNESPVLYVHVHDQSLAVPTPSTTVYLTKKGDTWESVAKALGVTVQALQAANPGGDKNLAAGQALIVPPAGQVAQQQAGAQPPAGGGGLAGGPKQAISQQQPPGGGGLAGGNKPPVVAPAAGKNQPLSIKNTIYSPSTVYYGACQNEPTELMVKTTIEPQADVSKVTLNYTYSSNAIAQKPNQQTIAMVKRGNDYAMIIDVGKEAGGILGTNEGWVSFWIEALDKNKKKASTQQIDVPLKVCKKAGPQAIGALGNPNQPAVNNNVSASPSTVYYGACQKKEPTSLKVKATFDPKANITNATLKYNYNMKAVVHPNQQSAPMTKQANDFLVEIDVSKEAAVYFNTNDGWVSYWIEASDITGKTSTTQRMEVPVKFCKIPLQQGGVPAALGGGGAGLVPLQNPAQGPMLPDLKQAGANGIEQKLFPVAEPPPAVGPNLPQYIPPSLNKPVVNKDCTVNLSWVFDNKDTQGFHVYRYFVPGSPRSTPIVVLPANKKEYKDAVPSAGVYMYKIAAILPKSVTVEGKEYVRVEVPLSESCPKAPISYKYICFWPRGYTTNTKDNTALWFSVGDSIERRIPFNGGAFWSPNEWGNVRDWDTIPAPASLYLHPDKSVDLNMRGAGYKQQWDCDKNPGGTCRDVCGDGRCVYDLGSLKRSFTQDELRSKVDFRSANASFTVNYRIWLLDYYWGGGEGPWTGADRIPEPLNLRIKNETAVGRTLAWDWNGDIKTIDAFILYRYYSCVNDNPIAVPLTLPTTSKEKYIKFTDEPAGCNYNYWTSAFGRFGESKRSNMLSGQTTPAASRIMVTFKDLNVGSSVSGQTRTQLFIAANQASRKSAAWMLEPNITYSLESVPFDGSSKNNAMVLDMAENEILGLNIVVSDMDEQGFVSQGSICQLGSILPAVRTWKDAKAEYKLRRAGCEATVLVNKIGAAPPPDMWANSQPKTPEGVSKPPAPPQPDPSGKPKFIGKNPNSTYLAGWNKDDKLANEFYDLSGNNYWVSVTIGYLYKALQDFTSTMNALEMNNQTQACMLDIANCTPITGAHGVKVTWSDGRTEIYDVEAFKHVESYAMMSDIDYFKYYAQGINDPTMKTLVMKFLNHSQDYIVHWLVYAGWKDNNMDKRIAMWNQITVDYNAIVDLGSKTKP